MSLVSEKNRAYTQNVKKIVYAILFAGFLGGVGSPAVFAEKNNDKVELLSYRPVSCEPNGEFNAILGCSCRYKRPEHFPFEIDRFVEVKQEVCHDAQKQMMVSKEFCEKLLHS